MPREFRFLDPDEDAGIGSEVKGVGDKEWDPGVVDGLEEDEGADGEGVLSAEKAKEPCSADDRDVPRGNSVVIVIVPVAVKPSSTSAASASEE